jgi:hypothetical protein
MKNQPRLTIQSLRKGNVSEDENPGRHPRDQEFRRQPPPAGNSQMRLFRDLQIVVVEADRAEAHGDQQHGPDIDRGKVTPQERRADNAGKHHKPAHCRRPGLLEVRLRTVGADRLALALSNAQRVDDRRPKQEDDKCGGNQRATRPEGDVAEDIEELELVSQSGQQHQHDLRFPSGGMAVACGSRKFLHQRVDDPGEPDAVGRFDHDDVPRPHHVHE